MNNSFLFFIQELRRGAARGVGFILLFLAAVSATAAPAPLKICLLSGSAEYDSEKSLTQLQSYLESHYTLRCQRISGQDKGNGLPGLEALNDADVMVVFTRRVKLPREQLQIIQKYIATGRAIIGIRTASHAFENYMEFDREVLGGGYKGHYSDEPAEAQIAPGRAQHPILAGVTSFTTRKLYKNPTLADDVLVLMEAATPTYREPVAWVRQHNGARVFYTSMGIQEDFTQEPFLKLLANAVFWTTRRDEVTSRRNLRPTLTTD